MKNINRKRWKPQNESDKVLEKSLTTEKKCLSDEKFEIRTKSQNPNYPKKNPLTIKKPKNP